jgi:hypothetical protein
MHRMFHRRALPWIGLFCILFAYVLSVLWLHPTNFFGLSEDDSIYFSSAKALAQGQGYILPSVPGALPATKYPILYPWILSLVWRWNPNFPANLAGAIAITVIFGLGYLTMVFLFLRSLKAFATAETLLLTAFCALHPLVLFYSASVLSDIPFAMLALSALVLADRAMQPGAGSASAAFCGLLGGLSILMRLFGLPIVLGIVIAALIRRTWRQLFIFVTSLTPFLAASAWRILFPAAAHSPASGASASSLGWSQSWAYYTNYLAIWKISVPNGHIFGKMVQNNALNIFSAPADFFLAPLFLRDTLVGHALVGIVAFTTLAGILRQARSRGWTPVHYALLPYSAVVLFWSFADANNRYFLPFWPLFVAGFLVELKHVIGMLRSVFFTKRPTFEKILAASLGALVFCLSAAVAVNYVSGTRRLLFLKSEERAALLRGRKGAYGWLSRFTPPGARVIAYDDPSVYLYTGRIAMRPIIFSTDALFAPERLNIAVDHMGDVARAIGAQYWLVADDDFDNEWPDATLRARAFTAALRLALSTVYTSPDGRVRIYSLSCLQQPEEPSCSSARHLLIPSE